MLGLWPHRLYTSPEHSGFSSCSSRDSFASGLLLGADRSLDSPRRRAIQSQITRRRRMQRIWLYPKCWRLLPARVSSIVLGKNAMGSCDASKLPRIRAEGNRLPSYFLTHLLLAAAQTALHRVAEHSTGRVGCCRKDRIRRMVSGVDICEQVETTIAVADCLFARASQLHDS